MAKLKPIITTLLVTLASYCISITFITWALPPGQVSIPHLAIGFSAGTLACLTFKTSSPSNTTT